MIRLSRLNKALVFVAIPLTLPVMAQTVNTQVLKEEALSLDKAIHLAQVNDPWLEGSRHSQAAMTAQSQAAGTMPDPQISVALLNLPTDSFDFKQEGMSQLKVGLRQMFPRGNSRELKQEQLQLLSHQYPYQRQDRQAKVAVIVAELWYKLYQAQQSIDLIENNRSLFEQLADVAQAGYASALGKVRQQDIVRAQLELTRLEDRLYSLRQQQEVYSQKLQTWLHSSDDLQADQSFNAMPMLQVTELMPQISPTHAHLLSAQHQDINITLAAFAKHPALLAIEKQIAAQSSEVELAKQSYKAQWGISASYAYRDENLMGENRADFLSLGVSFDLPIFTDKRQDQQVQASISKAEAIKTQKRLLLRNMLSAFESNKAKYLRLVQRQELYQSQLLPQMQEQAEASLTAYTNDDGDFAEVVRSRIAQLNAQIDLLGIEVESQIALMQINYSFIKASDSNAGKEGGTYESL